MKFEDVEWHFDPAASGPRLRAFVEHNGEPAELVAYQDGDWWLCLPKREYRPTASGIEADQVSAQRRVFEEWIQQR
jgi:hypothetical protein